VLSSLSIPADDTIGITVAASVVVLIVLWRSSALREEAMIENTSPIVLIALGLLVVAVVAAIFNLQQISTIASSVAAVLLVWDQIRRTSK